MAARWRHGRATLPDPVAPEPIAAAPDDRGPGDLGPGEPGDETEPTGPLRRCVATGESRDKAALIRFVVAPDGTVALDLEGRLPGRGMYVTADRAALERAVAKRAFARAARRTVTVREDLADHVENQILSRALGWLGLARRAGAATAGYDQVAAQLKAGRVAMLVQAVDAAEPGRARLAAMAGGRPVWEVLTAAELAQPFGRDRLVHVGLAPGGVTGRLNGELARLKAVRRADWETLNA